MGTKGHITNAGTIRGAVLGGVLLTLTLVHAVPYAGATVFSDTARDLDAAWDIVQGARPLLGPVINDTLHLGPIWFYLLAVPIALSESVAITLFVIGLLAALKFPLAYWLGRSMLGAQFGLLLALALTLPGWSSMGQMLPMHVVLVEAAILAALLPLLRLYRNGAAWWWPVYGFLQGLSLHAHPATLLLGLLVPAVACRRRGRSFLVEAASMGLGLVVAALPFLPMLMYEAASGWVGFNQLRAYGGGHALLPALLGAPALLGGIVLGGPVLIWDGLQGGRAATLLIVIHGALVAAAAIGWLCSMRDACARQRLGRACLLALLMLLGLAALRERTPWYMALAWQPWYALLLALGWYKLVGWRANSLTWIAAGALLLAIGSAGMWIVVGEAGVIPLRPQSLRDVQAWSHQGRSSFLPAWRLDRLGDRLCSSGKPIVLHGDVALAYDSALALPGRMQCDARHEVGIGGGSAATDADHLLGLSPWMLTQFGTAPSSWSAALRLQPLLVVAGHDTVQVALGEEMPYRERQRGKRTRHTLHFEAPASAVVVVNRPFYAYDRLDVLTALADLIPQTPVHERSALVAFRCATCTGTLVSWELRLESGNPRWVDVFVFDPSAIGGAESAPGSDARD